MFPSGQTSLDRTFSLAGIATEVQVRIEVLAPTVPPPPPPNTLGGPPAQQFAAAYAVDPVESVRQVFVRARVKYTIEFDAAAKADTSKDLTVVYKADGVEVGRVTYFALKEYTVTDAASSRTRFVKVASKVTFTLTNHAEAIGKKYGEDLTADPPGYITGKDNRSHLFGGQKDLRNNIPLNETVNQGRMKSVEGSILKKAKALAAGATLTVTVTPDYNVPAIIAELRKAAKADVDPDLTKARPKSVTMSSISNILDANDRVSKNKQTAIIENK